MGALIIIAIVIVVILRIRRYFTPKNPCPYHTRYSAVWATLASASAKRQFAKNFRAVKGGGEIVVLPTKRIYKMLVASPNGVDIFNYQSTSPTVWSMDYFTPFAAMREAGKNGQTLFDGPKEFEDLIGLFPQIRHTDQLLCFIKLFGLHAGGSIDPKTKLRVSKDGEVWIAFVTIQRAYRLHFTASDAYLFQENPQQLKDSALPALVSYKA